MQYLVYKITNSTNGRYYIGVHTTLNEQDSYMGSGTLIKRSIKKYGIENFRKEILYKCLNIEEAYEIEAHLVTEEIADDDISYNMTPGGKGGRYGKYSYMYGKTHSYKTKKYLGECASRQWKGIPKTEEHKKRISVAKQGKPHLWMTNYNINRKSYRIIYDNTIYRSVREAMRCTKKSQKYITDRSVRL